MTNIRIFIGVKPNILIEINTKHSFEKGYINV